MLKKNKFKSALAHKAKVDLAYEKDQREKRKELDIEDENVIIVEKSNSYKFTVNSIKALFKLICRVIIIILTIIGLIALIYPAPRSSLFMIIDEALRQLRDNLGPLIATFHNLCEALHKIIYQLQEYIK